MTRNSSSKSARQERGERNQARVRAGEKLGDISGATGNAYAISHKMIHECLNIRNRYAHCNWRKDGRQLEFLDAKDIFKDGTAPQDDERWRRLTIPILKAQAAFFEGTRKWLLYLGLMLQASEDQKPLWKAPPQMQPPPGHSERRKRSPARVGKSRPHKRTKPS